MLLQKVVRRATARPVNAPPFDLSCGEADTPNYSTKIAPDQAKIIDASRRFRRAQARPLRPLVVRISVRATGQRRWKSLRRFILSADEVDDLLDTATRLEQKAKSAILRSWAAVLGGEVIGNGVLCPGPGRSAIDRSLYVIPTWDDTVEQLDGRL